MIVRAPGGILAILNRNVICFVIDKRVQSLCQLVDKTNDNLTNSTYRKSQTLQGTVFGLFVKGDFVEVPGEREATTLKSVFMVIVNSFHPPRITRIDNRYIDLQYNSEFTICLCDNCRN